MYYNSIGHVQYDCINIYTHIIIMMVFLPKHCLHVCHINLLASYIYSYGCFQDLHMVYNNHIILSSFGVR